MKHVGADLRGRGMEEMVCLMGYDMIKAHRGQTFFSRFITTHRC
jgi:hypothetical protein